jgi:hypothetical protein
MSQDEILVPKGRVKPFVDYYHRKFTLDCHIQCEREVLTNFFYRYFDSNTPLSMEYGKYRLIPDGAFMVTHNSASSLYALEVYNDNDTSRIIKQLNKHIECLETSALGKSVGIEKGHRVCCVFYDFNVMRLVMQNFDPQQEGRFFLFKTHDEVLQSFTKNWIDMLGNAVDLI